MKLLSIGLCIGVPLGALIFILIALAMPDPKSPAHVFSSFTDPRGIPLDGFSP